MLPFTLGPVTVVQDEQSFIQPPRVPVAATCATCGASFRTTADPDDDAQLRHVANSVMRNMCPSRGHGAYPV